jgi:hypothetical protein
MAVDVDVTKESVAVFVDVSAGDKLIFRVTVRGAAPIFTLVDSQTHRRLMSSDDQPVATMPAVVFVRIWPKVGDQVLAGTSHTMAFQFFAAISYRYEVELNRADGTSDLVLDITYSANEPEEEFFQDLQVTTI